MLSTLKVPCRRCGGRMNGLDISCYLRGVAHGSGQDYATLLAAVFPPEPIER